MKISYNWIKQYLDINLDVKLVSQYLTDCGLEVETIEHYESIKGGLKGFIIGEVITQQKHPDADRLSLTTVNIGEKELLSIVCGAPNVAAGQKVVVATIGTIIYSEKGNFEIKKSKIRGAVSEGMICAEDEIGIGSSHDGILVLNSNAIVGTKAKDFFQITEDFIFEIGLTPNRIDAASHLGVARDLAAVLNANGISCKLNFPSVEHFKIDNEALSIDVFVEDYLACPRYSGVTISGIEVKNSPKWLQDRLKSVGLRPINNIVDCTNFIMLETGQPLHAFNTNKITGNKIIVKTLDEGTPFITLDGQERKLKANDLMICNTVEGMCMAGVFGGLHSGVEKDTENIFIESACFNPGYVRKTSKQHGLKTDASFRFERGSDPEMTIYALKRAALLIKEVAGGCVSSSIIDTYPYPAEWKNINIKFSNIDLLIGKSIEKEKIQAILVSLGIKIISADLDGLSISIPPPKWMCLENQM